MWPLSGCRRPTLGGAQPPGCALRRGHRGLFQEAADCGRPPGTGRMGRRVADHRVPGHLRRDHAGGPRRNGLFRISPATGCTSRSSANIRPTARTTAPGSPGTRTISPTSAWRSGWTPTATTGREGQGDLRFYQMNCNAQGGIYDVSFDPENRPEYRLERPLGVQEHGGPCQASLDGGDEPSLGRPGLESEPGDRQDPGRTDRAKLQGALGAKHVVPGPRGLHRLVPLCGHQADRRRPDCADHLAGREGARGRVAIAGPDRQPGRRPARPRYRSTSPRPTCPS